MTDTGYVEKHVVTLPPSIPPSDVEKMVNILNERLTGVPLEDLTDKIQTEVAHVLREHIQSYDHMLRMISSSLDLNAPAQMFLSGKMNMLRQPEFSDIDKLRALFNIIEQEKEFYRLLRKHNQQGIQVKIGTENDVEGMENCSLITATYSVGGEKLGTIAVLGYNPYGIFARHFAAKPCCNGFVEGVNDVVSKILAMSILWMGNFPIRFSSV